MFDLLESRLIVEYEIRTLSDLHIGGHESSAPGDVDMAVIRDSGGYPIVPGSSLKGVLRSEMERLLRGLPKRACTPEDLCDPKKVKECTVCQLFGGRELAASIRVRDAVTESKKTLVRDGVRIDRKTRRVDGAAKYTIEVVPKGTMFSGIITIENPKLETFKYAKLGALLGTIRFFNATARSLGGGVSRGFGEVLIVPLRIREITAKNYLEGKYGGTELLSLESAVSDEALGRGELPMKGKPPMENVDQSIQDWKGCVEALDDAGE